MKFQTYLAIVLTLAVFGIVGFGGYFVMQQTRIMAELKRSAESPSAPEGSDIVGSPDTTNQPDALQDDFTSAPQPSSSPLASPSPMVAKKAAVVIFEADGAFSTPEKTQIGLNVTSPYQMYHDGSTGSGSLLTLTIRRNTNPSSSGTYPYSAQAVFDTGVNEGFLIQVDGGTVDSGGQVQLWVPECMVKCQFSPEFQATYPEIVAKAGN